MPIHGLGLMFLAITTFGISNVFLSFIINKQTAVYYLENGYKPVGPNWSFAAKTWGISLPQDVQQSISPSPEAEVKVVVSPLPLLWMSCTMLASSILMDFLFIVMAYGTILYSLLTISLVILQLAVFIWAANEYLSKIGHKIFAILVMFIYLIKHSSNAHLLFLLDPLI